MIRLVRALLLVVVVLLGACSTPPPATPTTVSIAITAEPPTEPTTEEVPLGSLVTLVVSSEVDGLLHVHGYELKIPLRAGGTVEETFTATISGVLDVETHDPDAVWVKLVVS